METPNNGKLRVAIVGAGYVARHHIAALRRLDFIEIVAICDLDLAAARALAAASGVANAATGLAGIATSNPQAGLRADPARQPRTRSRSRPWTWVATSSWKSPWPTAWPNATP